MSKFHEGDRVLLKEVPPGADGHIPEGATGTIGTPDNYYHAIGVAKRPGTKNYYNEFGEKVSVMDSDRIYGVIFDDYKSDGKMGMYGVRSDFLSLLNCYKK